MYPDKKYNLVIPLAGKGQRMVDAGYTLPKPLLNCCGKTILEWSMDSIDYSECKLHFILKNNDRETNLFIQEKWPGSEVYSLKDSPGAMHSVLQMTKNDPEVNQTLPLIVFCPDIYLRNKFIPNDSHFKDAGHILTFKATSSAYSYVKLGTNNNVEVTVEKRVISENASVGIYCFRDSNLFNWAASKQKSDRESYICPMYNCIIQAGQTVTSSSTPIIYIMGTPQELLTFGRFIYPHLLPKKHLVICSDHSGFEAKKYLMDVSPSFNNASMFDVGTYSEDDCNYNYYVKDVAKAITKPYLNEETGFSYSSEDGIFGIGLCRSGQGINIFANKQKHIRAALCYDRHTVQYAIEHNAANFFSIPSRLPFTEIERIVQDITNYNYIFEGGRHQNRIMNEYDCN